MRKENPTDRIGRIFCLRGWKDYGKARGIYIGGGVFDGRGESNESGRAEYNDLVFE